MIFLPIVGRELRVAARRRGTYWGRTVVALAAIGVVGFLYLGNLAAAPPELGQRIFCGLAVLLLLYGLGAGRWSTADCLSAEKREGTLGLLFLTDLKGYDVVFGKLTATSLSLFYSLLAVFPVLAITLLLGGISNGEFWRVVLVLVNTFLFSLAVGIFVSALSREAHRALGANLLVLLLLIGVLPGCAGVVLAVTDGQRFVPQLLYSCPVYSLFLCADFFYFGRKLHFWLSVGVVHALTWALVALASWRAPYSWQDRAANTGPGRWRQFLLVWTYGTSAKRTALRRRLLSINAFFWLAARVRSKPAQVWVVLALVAGWWVSAWATSGPSWRYEAMNPTNFVAAIIFNATLKLWLALEAGRQLAEDHKSGAFELLLSTPLTTAEMLRGQFLALRRQFLKPLMAVMAAELAFLAVAIQARSPSPDDAVVPVVWVAGILMLVADLAALSWVAMWTALTARSPNQATVATVVRVLLLPWLAFALVAVPANIILPRTGPAAPGSRFYLGLWFVLGMATDLGYGLAARYQLLTRFRELAQNIPGREKPELEGRVIPKPEFRSPKEARNPNAE